MSPLLEVRQLRKEFRPRAGGLLGARPRVRAVTDVDLDLEIGETLALVGESGCGKTTLGRLIARLVEPSSGAIRFAGSDLLALTGRELRRRRRDLQMVFQDPEASLDPRMRLVEAVAEPLVAFGLAAGSELSGRVERLLAEVGLSPQVARRFPHELSGGQRQRVAIARALAPNPRLLIADEPVSALDVSVRGQILNLLAELQRDRGLALLFIAHDLAVVGHLAQRVAVMYLGRIVEVGPVRDLLERPRHPYTAGLVAAAKRRAGGPGVSAVGAATGEPPSPTTPPSGCAYHPRCPLARERCVGVRPELVGPTGGWRVACHLADEAESSHELASGHGTFVGGRRNESGRELHDGRDARDEQFEDGAGATDRCLDVGLDDPRR